MRNKRLSHAADVFGKMFCGWRLANSFAEMSRLGSGSLRVDILQTNCLFNGIGIPAPPIAYELHHWFAEDLQRHNIDQADIRSAVLVADLRITVSEAKIRGVFHFDENGLVRSRRNVHCIISCTATITTATSEYTGRHSGVEAWPQLLATATQ